MAHKNESLSVEMDVSQEKIKSGQNVNSWAVGIYP